MPVDFEYPLERFGTAVDVERLAAFDEFGELARHARQERVGVVLQRIAGDAKRLASDVEVDERLALRFGRRRCEVVDVHGFGGKRGVPRR